MEGVCGMQEQEFQFSGAFGGIESIIVKFKCDSCGNDVVSEDIFVPEYNYTSETMHDGEGCEDGYASCDACGKDFEIEIYSSGLGRIRNYNGNGHIKVIENEASASLYEDEELQWELLSENPQEIFEKHLDCVSELLNQVISDEQTKFSLLVMLYGHTIAAMERYLSIVFLKEVSKSSKMIAGLVRTDPELKKRSFTLEEINKDQNIVYTVVIEHIKSIIFHNIAKIELMYKSTMGVDLGKVDWLFKAVKKRHDCVHRAGFDKDGNMITITKEEIEKLVIQCRDLANHIENEIKVNYSVS